MGDNDHYYSTDASVDIFNVREDGEKRIEPGSAGSYDFLLLNTGTAALDYGLTLEARMFLGDRDLTIPVVVQLYDSDGNYVLGSATEKVPVLELNQVADSGVIAGGRATRYTLTWEWPFEDGTWEWDDYDTNLGDIADGETLSLYIAIHAVASADANPNAEGGSPYTGDNSDLLLWAILAVGSLAVLLLVLLLGRDREDKRKNQERHHET
jgi:hypothetical protein